MTPINLCNIRRSIAFQVFGIWNNLWSIITKRFDHLVAILWNKRKGYLLTTSFHEWHIIWQFSSQSVSHSTTCLTTRQFLKGEANLICCFLSIWAGCCRLIINCFILSLLLFFYPIHHGPVFFISCSSSVYLSLLFSHEWRTIKQNACLSSYVVHLENPSIQSIPFPQP